jgi:hypothetical protein
VQLLMLCAVHKLLMQLLQLLLRLLLLLLLQA